ncbi:outer membrane protein assembly factor BamE [Oxalobacteraceae bacterium R-40]|uniref:Outer membrane protein assembly factor BamE n=1 Tax=Keguizhuia sedimenti TaxID=3064264 RepID=A0ABU1BMT1_9BURK|nr:outer membrane protein assembly factor BamE [Oxalobacteraceae bacterium R-40]
MKQLIVGIFALFGILMLVACDEQGRPVEEFGLEKLAKGISTESDVRMVMGQPGTVWDAEDGSRSLEYPKGPEGHRTWFFDIGKDGKLKDYRQVLTEEYFEKIKPGMSMDAVRRMMGKPRSAVQYKLKNEEVWEWLYLERPGVPRIFNVHFDLKTNLVTRTFSFDPEQYRG